MEDRGTPLRPTERPVSAVLATSRRDFLRVTAVSAGGLVLGVRWARAAEEAVAEFRPNAWVRIDPSGKVMMLATEVEIAAYNSKPRAKNPRMGATAFGRSQWQVSADGRAHRLGLMQPTWPLAT